MSQSSLAGKVALVTGAAKRIGRSVALRLASEGADVVVNYRSSKSEADEVVAQIAAMGRRAVAVQGDVGKKNDVTALFRGRGKGIRPLGYPRQQCRNVLSREIRGADRRAVGPHPGHKFEIAIFVFPGGSADAAAQRPRPDHQLRVARRLAGLAGLHALLRIQGGSRSC